MKKAVFHTLGCKVNFAETSTLARQFAADGFEIVGSRTDDDGDADGSAGDTYGDGTSGIGPGYSSSGRIPRADVYVVNSCAVTAAAEKKCRNLISKIRRRSPDAEIIVTGCYAALSPKTVAALPGVTKVMERDFGKFSCAWSAGDRTRSFLKVQDGCDYKCAYCTIHYARGGSRNPSVASLTEQAREITSRGVKEIVLTGVNTGDFGRTTGENFTDLLRSLDAVEGIERYRISSIEPNLLTDEVIEFCASSEKFQPHFHIPLQSGSDRILGLMRRRYTTAKFADRIEKVRSVMPDTFFGVDVIVGFPGETDEDFAETVAFLERVRPSQLHVFPYSVRPGTPAADMPGKVAPAVAAARAAVLGELSEVLHREFVAKYSGTRARVLWEGGSRPSRAAASVAATQNPRTQTHDRQNPLPSLTAATMSGFTGNYIRLTAPWDPARVNTITEALLD